MGIPGEGYRFGIKRQICIPPCIDGMIVAGAELCVGNGFFPLFAHYEGDLAMNLEPDNTIDNVYTSCFKPFGQLHVRLFIVTCFQLDYGQHRLARLGC